MWIVSCCEVHKNSFSFYILKFSLGCCDVSWHLFSYFGYGFANGEHGNRMFSRTRFPHFLRHTRTCKTRLEKDIISKESLEIYLLLMTQILNKCLNYLRGTNNLQTLLRQTNINWYIICLSMFKWCLGFQQHGYDDMTLLSYSEIGVKAHQREQSLSISASPTNWVRE